MGVYGSNFDYGDSPFYKDDDGSIVRSETLRFITLDESYYVDVNRPNYGYETEIHMPISMQQSIDGAYSFWDNGYPSNGAGVPDYRVISTSQWQNDPTTKAALNEFFINTLKGRCENVTMSLGANPCGFFPFGPDYGDSGDFTVRLYDREQSGRLQAPYNWFEDNLKLVLVPPAPAYTLPTQQPQGNFTIGSVQNIMFPQNGFQPVAKYNHQTGLTKTGVPYSIDGPSVQDSFETSFDQQCNQSKAAALCALLTGSSGRTNDITIVGQSNFYAFGMDKGSAGTYTCKFLGSSNTKSEIIITVKHIGFNQFELPLNFWMKAAA